VPFRGQGAIRSGHALLPCVPQAVPVGEQGLTAGDRHCPDGCSSALSASGRMTALWALGGLPAWLCPPRLSCRWFPIGLSEVSATWKHMHASDGRSGRSPTSLLAQHSPLGWSHQEMAPDSCFIASWTVAWDLV